MADRLHAAHLQIADPASRKIRLIDFETGKAVLQPEHKAWLDETVHFLPSQGNFWIYIYGFASKLGPQGGHGTDDSRTFNLQLSYERANAVARYLENATLE